MRIRIKVSDTVALVILMTTVSSTYLYWHASRHHPEEQASLQPSNVRDVSAPTTLWGQVGEYSLDCMPRSGGRRHPASSGAAISVQQSLAPQPLGYPIVYLYMSSTVLNSESDRTVLYF